MGAQCLAGLFKRRGDTGGAEALYGRAVDRGNEDAAYALYELRWKSDDRYGAILALRSAARLGHPDAEARLKEITRSA